MGVLEGVELLQREGRVTYRALKRRFPRTVMTSHSFLHALENGARCSTASIIVEPDGAVFYPCRALGIKPFNLLDGDLNTFLRSPLAAELRGKDGELAARVMEALFQEDVVRAQELLTAREPLAEASPNLRFAGGALRFHQQRYAEAVALLEGSGLTGLGMPYLALARAALQVNQDHARFEGEHFVVSYPPGKDEVLVPYVVDALERQRAALEEAPGVAPDGRLAVEIVNDVKELARLTTLTEAEIRTSGTVAVCKFDKLMLLSPKALLKGYAWLDTAAHEYTHLVITLKSRNEAPIWLQEGLAKWFEDDWRGGGEPRGEELHLPLPGLRSERGGVRER